MNRPLTRRSVPPTRRSRFLWLLASGLILAGPAWRLRAQTGPRTERVGNHIISRVFAVGGGQAFTTEFAAQTTLKVSSKEFDLAVEANHHESVINRRDCSLTDFHFSPDGLKADFFWTCASPALEVKVSYWAGAETPYLFKQVQVANRGTAEVRIVRASLDALTLAGSDEPLRGGVGQPVLLSNQWFFGIEHPAALNQVRGRAIVLSEFPGAQLAPGADWQSDREVVGATVEANESVEDAFRSYLVEATGRKPQFRKVYCDWGAHDEMGTLVHPQLTYQLTQSLLDQLKSMQRKHKIHFDDYTIDAFWYDPRGAFLTFKKPNWPEGFEPALKQIRALGMKPGLWFDLGGGTLDLAHTPGWDGPAKPCLSDPSFDRLLDKGLAFHIEHDGLTLVEFDFANLNCTHNPDGPSLAVMERNADALRAVIEKARKLNPSLFIRAYNTFSLTTMMDSTNYYDEAYPVSPWWLYWFDSIYCGDPRPADMPSVTSLRDSVDTYQDHAFRGFARSLLPLFAIDDSGTIVGKTSTIYYLGAEGFSDSWILNIMRGDLTPTFFGDLRLLTPHDRSFLASTLDFAHQYQSVLEQTRPILGVPGRGEVYGYQASSPGLSFVTLVNPGLFQQLFGVEIGALLHEPYSKLIFSNDVRATAPIAPVAGVLSGSLAGGEIRVYALGGQPRISGISLPYAPTRKFHKVVSFGDPFEGKTTCKIFLPRGRAGSTLAVILRYSRGGLADRSSHTPQNVIKVEGSLGAKSVTFRSIPRQGTDIWSGGSWAVFKHEVTAGEVNHSLTLALIGTPPTGTHVTVQAMWLK
jgi:hypothetical protein